jgi:hypothetical protein
MRCVVGLWTEDAFNHKANALCAIPTSSYVWTGAEDGVIVRYGFRLSIFSIIFEVRVDELLCSAVRCVVLMLSRLQVGQQQRRLGQPHAALYGSPAAPFSHQYAIRGLYGSRYAC